MYLFAKDADFFDAFLNTADNIVEIFFGDVFKVSDFTVNNGFICGIENFGQNFGNVSATEAPFLSSPILVRVISGSFAVVLVISAAALAATEISPPRTTSFLMMTFFPPLSFQLKKFAFPVL